MPADYRQLMGVLAGVISAIAFVPYIISTVRGITRPNRATWMIWTVVGVLLASSYHYSGATHTIWVAVSYILGPLVTFLFSMKYGEGGWGKWDRWCIVGTALSLIFWWVSKSATIGLLASLTIEFFGSIPTIRKSYLEPEKEDKLAWVLSSLGNALNLLAIQKGGGFAITVYPVYMFIEVGLITTLVIYPRRRE